MEKVASPLVIVAEPSNLAPSMNSILPVGSVPPLVVTSAVKITGLQVAAGLAEDLICTALFLMEAVVPVPLSGTDWGELPPLSAIVIAPVSAPVVVGLKAA